MNGLPAGGKTLRLFLCVVGLLGLLAADCREPRRKAFLLATTTSVENSGLLRHLAERFDKKAGIEIQPLVVGSGKALRLARERRVQAILTHDPHGERAFVASGGAVLYRRFARNDFILVGPPSNPARVSGEDSVTEAFQRIHHSRSGFASRGDESGTHVRELEIWRRAGMDPRTNPNYVSLGHSMSALLRSTDQLESYTLTDRATFEQLRDALDLAVYVDRGEELLNTYAVTLVKSSGPEATYAAAFVDWLLSAEGRRSIESFRIKGKQAFFLIE